MIPTVAVRLDLYWKRESTDSLHTQHTNTNESSIVYLFRLLVSQESSLSMCNSVEYGSCLEFTNSLVNPTSSSAHRPETLYSTTTIVSRIPVMPAISRNCDSFMEYYLISRNKILLQYTDILLPERLFLVGRSFLRTDSRFCRGIPINVPHKRSLHDKNNEFIAQYQQ